MLLNLPSSLRYINQAIFIFFLSGLLAGCAAGNTGKDEGRKNDEGDYLACMKNATESWNPSSGEGLTEKINKECK
ncbi:hypothetical protein [Aeromonas salmonicida]|uniref:hypothetical protein n=1 Tax=Aeromonas salmonicida TaxID=645 RepID=UPI00259FB080|nr:hypothetical protein [Aeromonas salmonicida]MDM5100313.1 hypothetical protein [Aeromonas salmonicida]